MKKLVQILCVGLAIVGLFSVFSALSGSYCDCDNENNGYVSDREVLGVEENEWLVTYGAEFDDSFGRPMATLRIANKRFLGRPDTRYIKVKHRYTKKDFDYCTVAIRLKYDDIGDNVFYGQIPNDRWGSIEYIEQIKEISVGAYEAFYTLTYYKDDEVIKDYTVETVLVMDGLDFDYNGK